MKDKKIGLSKQIKVPVGYIVIVLVVMVVLVVCCIILAETIKNLHKDTPLPPDEPEQASFIEEGEHITRLFYGDEIVEDYRFVNSQEDINKFFISNEDVFEEYRTNLDGDIDIDGNYLLVKTRSSYCGGGTRAVGISEINDGTATVIAEQNGSCGVCAPEYDFWLIPIEEYDISDVDIRYATINNYECNPDVSYKPVIYLYPETDMDISVKLGAKEKLLVSYPAYSDGWNVLAHKDGTLKDTNTGRELYSLYYEAENTVANGLHKDGFVVEGADTAKFLEEKLATLGLNAHESEEFIIYWLPKMQDNAYNYIYFATNDEVAENMPLIVSPAPDTTIRINMEWKALDEPISVKLQKLPDTPERKGFTLVEWGGTILE